MKLCSKCGKTKPETEFYRMGPNNPKPRAYCKECGRQSDKDYRKKNMSSRIAYSRSYEQSTKGSPKTKARNKLKTAINNGTLVRPSQCQKCGATGSKGAGNQIEGHHPDYSQPLKVEWLCRSCHMRLYRSGNHP